MAAESYTEEPTATGFAERVVLTTGPVLLTVRGSHELVTGLLFASPLYDAWKLYAPAVGGPVAWESGTTPLVTGTVETTTPETVHPASENKVYVTVPPAFAPFDRVEESWTRVPIGTLLPETVVVMLGAAWFTVRGSQRLVAPPLFASPLYMALQLNEPAELKAFAADPGIAPFVTVTVDTTAGVPVHDAVRNEL